jgi:serralysin
MQGARIGCASNAPTPQEDTMPAPASLNTIIEKLRTSWMEDSLYGEHHDWIDQSTVSYHLYNTPSPFPSATEASGIMPMTAREAAHARLAFELWDDLIARDLNESFGRDPPNISFALSKTSGTYASTESSGTDLVDADVWIYTNPGDSADALSARDASMFFGSDAFGNSYLHEIGHSLGLSHPGRYDGGDSAPDIYRFDAEYAQDTRQYTVMSYFDAGEDGSTTNHMGSFAATPLLHDIAAIQAIYGPDLKTRADVTTYGFDSNAGKMIDGFPDPLNPYDFDQNPRPVFAIWDAGGIDTINASRYTTSQRINLAPGAFSSIGDGGQTNNIAMALEVRDDAGQVVNLIEIAIGGSGDDEIRGNDASNRLDGGGGKDKLYAGVGVDTLVGGTGNDKLWGSGDDILCGGANDDTYYVTGLDDVREGASPSGGRDTVHTELSSYSLRPYVEDLVFTNPASSPTNPHTGDGNSRGNTIKGAAGVDTFFGNDGSDHLYGRAGADTLHGGTGSDWLYGEAGKDTLTGGANADVFVFNNVLHSSVAPSFVFGGGMVDNVDTITDFVHGVDKIDLRGIDANAATRTVNENFSWLSNPESYTGDWTGKVWFQQDITSWGTWSGTILDEGGQTLTIAPGGTTTLFASTDADALPEFQVTLTGVVPLTIDDFLHPSGDLLQI